MTRATRIRQFGAAAAMVALLSGCASTTSGNPIGGSSSTPSPTTEPLPAEVCGSKIGFMGPLSGPNAPIARGPRDAAQLAIDEFKERHPDCAIELVEFDTGKNPDQARPVAEKALADRSVIGIVGPTFSGEAFHAIPVLRKTDLAMISPSAVNPELTQRPSTFHRVAAHDDESAEAAARYIDKTLEARRVYVVGNGSSYSKVLIAKVKSALGAAVKGETALGEELDYPAQVKEIMSADADVVFFAGYHEGGQLLAQLREAGSEVKFVTGDGSYGPEFLNLGGRDAEGAIAVCGCAPAAISESFSQAFDDTYGEQPPLYAVEGYEAATVFLDALAAGNANRDDVLSFIDSYDKQGISKQIKFTDNGDLAQPTVWAYHVRDGKFGDAEVIE